MESQKRTGGHASLVLALLAAVASLLIYLDINRGAVPLVEFGFLAEYETALVVIFLVSIVWVVLVLLGPLFEIAAGTKESNRLQIRTVWRFVSYIAWGMTIILALLFLFGDVTSTALSVGLVGAALAFALQKPLLNIAGWISINYHTTYRIGDRVGLGVVRGYVSDIKVMHTEVYEMGEWMKGDTFTGRVVIVPNSSIFDGPVYNYTRDAPYIWDEVTNLVTYESDIDLAKGHMLSAAKEVVGEMMARDYEKYRSTLLGRDFVYQLPSEPRLRMNLSDSGVNITVQYWCLAEMRGSLRSEIIEKIWRRFNADPSVGIAYPHMELVKDNGSGEKR